MSAIKFEIRVPVEITKEDDVFVATCQALDVVSQGCTQEDAMKNVKEAIRLFLEMCYEMGTLNEVLLEAGFRKSSTEEKQESQNNIIDVMLSYFASQRSLECLV